VPPVALHAYPEPQDAALGNVEREADARWRRHDQARALALAGESVAGPDLTGPHRIARGSGEDGRAVEVPGELGDGIVDDDRRGQRAGALLLREPPADTGDCEDGRRDDQPTRGQIESLRRLRRRMRRA
jgi:hypothetical protein